MPRRPTIAATLTSATAAWAQVRGAIGEVRGRAIVANLPRSIAERELATIAQILSLVPSSLAIEEIRDSAGHGNAAIVEVVTEDHTEVFTGFGKVGVRAETMARRAACEVRDYIESGLPVGICLADQVLVPMALARSGRFRTGPLSRHATTDIDVIRRFVGAHIQVEEDSGRSRIVAFGLR